MFLGLLCNEFKLGNAFQSEATVLSQFLQEKPSRGWLGWRVKCFLGVRICSQQSMCVGGLLCGLSTSNTSSDWLEWDGRLWRETIISQVWADISGVSLS